MAERLIAALYRALLADKPKGEVPGWLPARRWVLSKDTCRELAREQGEPLPEDYDWSQDGGSLLGLPYRVDETVDGFALEPLT